MTEKRAPITFVQQPDGSWLITAHSPRDGARRPLTYDLHYRMSTTELRSLNADLAFALAGAE